MDQTGERGQQASARTLPSDLRPQDTQPPRPGTPFHVPQHPSDLRPQDTQPPRPGTPFHVPQRPSDLRPQYTQPPRPGTPFRVPQLPSDLRPQYTQPPRPGTPFSVPQSRSDPLLKCGKFKDQDFGSLGFLRPTRHTARCSKPYEDKRFKRPSVLTESSLRNLRALIKASASKKTPDPMKELEKIKEMNVPLPLKVPEGNGNPLSRGNRPDDLETATRKRKREDLSSVLISEEKRGSPMDFGQANTRVPEIPSKHCSGDATENLQEDDPMLAPTCADSSSVQSALVISPHIQVSPKPSLSSQGAVGSSTSSQDAQGQSLTRQEALGLTQCVQGAMRHTTSAQAPQRPPTCVESKIIHVQHSQGDFKISSSTQGFSALSDCPQKRFKKDHPGAGEKAQPLKARLKTKKVRKAPSDQEGLHCVPLDTESSKPSQKGDLSDLSCPPNGLSLTTSPQESLTPLKVTKGNQQVAPHQEDSQRYSPSPPKDTTQSTSGQVSLSTDPVDQGDLPVCPSQSVKGELGLSTSTEKSQRCVLKSRLPPKLRFKCSAMKRDPERSHSSRRSGKVPAKQEDSTLYLSESQSYQCPSPAKKALLTLQQAPKSHIHAKALHRSHESSNLSPSKQEVPGPTNSEHRASQSSPTMQKGFVKHPSQGAEIRHSPSSQVESRHPISTRKRLRDDPSDQVYPSKEDSFSILPYTKKGCASPSAAEERSVATTTPQVSPPPSLSVQKSLGCSTPDQSNQGPPGHSVSSQEAQGPSQSSPTFLGSSLSAPEPQGPSVPLSVSSEHVPRAQSALSISKSDLKAENPSLSGQGSEGKPTSPQKHVGLVPQEDLTPSTSSKASKKSSVSCLLPGGHLPSSLGSPVPSTSTQGYLGTSSPVHGSLRRRSSSVPGILCSSPLAQGTTDTLPSAQGVQSFPSLPRHLKYLPHLRGDLQHSSLSPGILAHALPAQGTLETSSCSPGVPGPLVSLQKPLGVSTTAQSTASVSPVIQGSLGSLFSSTSKVGSSQPAPKLSEPLVPTKTGLEISPSTLVALGPSPVAPEHQGLPSLPPETSTSLPHSRGALDLSKNVSRNLSLTPSTQCHHRIPPSSESSVAALGSAQGAAGHALSEQQAPEWSRYTQATVGHSLPAPGAIAPSLSSQGILGQMSSGQMDMGTYAHVLGSVGHFTNISAFPGHMLSVQGPVATSSTEQGRLRHLPSAQKAVELSQSAQRAPELPALVQVTARPLQSTGVPLINPVSSQGTLGHFQCAQAALQPFPPSVGALKHSPAGQGAHKHFPPAQGALQNLPSNSKAVESPRAPGGLQSSLSAARALQDTLCAKKPEQLPISALRSLGRSLSVQKAPESLTPSLRYLEPGQSGQKRPRTLTLSQIALQSAISNPSTSGTPMTLSSSPGNMRLSSLANKTPEHSQGAEDMVVEPSPSARRFPESMSFAQTSLKNSLSGQRIMESLSSPQGGVKPSHSTQGSVKLSTSTKQRVGNVSSPKMPRKALPSLQLSRPSPLSQGPHQDSSSASGPLGPSFPDPGTQRPWLPSEASGNSTSAPGTLQPGPFIPKTQDHLQTAERPFQLPIPEQRMLDPSTSTQGALGLLVSSSEEPSESKHRKPGHSSYVGKDRETSLPDTVAKGTSPSAPQSLFATEALGSSSFGQGSQRSWLCPREGVKDSPSAPDAQEPSPSTSQPQPDKNALGNLPAGRKALGSPPSTLGPTNISSFAPVPLGHSSLQIQTPAPLPCVQEVVESFVSEQGTLGPSTSAKSSAGLVESTVEARVPSLSGKDNIELSISASGSKAQLQSSGSSASKHYHQIKVGLSPSLPEDLIYSPSDQKALGMSKCAQGALENFPFAQGAVALPTCTQEASKPSVSAEDHVHGHVPNALGPSYSKQGTEKSLLSPLENMKHLASATGAQKPFVDSPGPQDTLPTTKQCLNSSISACDTLCPLPSTLESGELSSTLSPGILGPSNSSQRELGYLSTIEQTVEYSPSAPPNTRTLPPPLRCTEKLSLVSSAQETSQSSPGDLLPLISAQGPLKLSTLTQRIPDPSASIQESLECSKSPHGIVRTHQSSQKFHEHLTPVVETVESLSVSGSTITSSASPPLEHSSLPQGTSATSLTNQELVGPILPLQRTLKMSSARGPLEHVVSVQGKGTTSQSKAITLGQNISAQETLGPSPCTMGVEGSTPCAHKKPGMLSSTEEAKKHSLSPRVALELPISETGTLENLPSDQGCTNNFNSFQKTSSQSLPIQSTVKQPSSAIEAQSLSSSTQRINNPLSSPGALKTSTAPNTRTLPPPLRCTEKLSLVSSAQETSQSSPGDLPPLISAQGPLKLSTLIQGIPGPSASIQESLECSKSPHGIVRTHQSSQKFHEHLTPVVETVESLSVSGSTITSSASPPLEHSSLPQGTSATSLTNQELVGPILPLQRTLKMSSARGTLEHVVSVQGKGTTSQSKAITLGQNISAQETLGPSPCTMGVEGSIPCAHKEPGMLSSTEEAKKHSLSPRVALELPISETGTLENLPSDQGCTNNFNSFQKTSSQFLPMQSTVKQPSSATEAQRLSSSTQRINNPFLSSPAALKTSSVLSAQKHPQTTPRALPTLACNQMPLEHSISVQGTLGPLLSTPGSLEQSASFQRKLGHLPCLVESQDTSPSVKGTPGPVPFPSVNSGYDQGCQEPSLSTSRDLAHLLSTKLYISAQGTLGPSSYNEQSLQHSSSSQELLGASKCAQCTPKQFSSVSDTLGVSPCAPKTLGTLPHSLEPVGLYSRQHISPAPPTPLQKDVETCLYSKATLELKASAQGSLEPSLSTQMPGQVSLYAEATLGEPITPQETEERLASTKETAQQNLDLFSSSQGYLSISLSAEGTFESWPSEKGPQGPSLSVHGSLDVTTPDQGTDKGAQGPSLSVHGSLNVTTPEQGTTETLSYAQKASEYQTSSQETLRFSPSTQHTVQHSTSFPSGPEPFISSQKSQETLSSTLRDAKYSPSAPGAQAHLQSSGSLGGLPSSPREPQRHSSSSQGTAQTFSPGQGVLAPLQSAQRPLKLSTSSQTMLHPSRSAERAPQPSAAYPAVPEAYVNSQSTRGAAGTSPSAAGHLDNSTSAQETPSISQSDQGAVGPCPSAEGTQKISRYAQGSIGHSPYAQGSGGHFLSAQATLGNSTSAEQNVGPLPSMQEPQASTQSTQMILGSLSSDPRPLKISLSAQGTVGPLSSAQGALGPSLCAQGSLKLFTPEQGTVGTVPSAPKASKHLSSSAQHNVQHSPSSPRAPGSFISHQTSQETSLSSPGAAKHSPSAPGTEKHPLSVSGLLGPLLSTQGPEVLTRDEERTLSVQSSLSSIQNTLGQSSSVTNVSRQYRQIQSTLCHFPSVGEDVESSQSTPGTIELGGHSSPIQATARSYSLAQGRLAPLQPAQTILHTPQSADHAPRPLEAYQAVPDSYENVYSTLSTARTSLPASGHVDLSASAQGTPQFSQSDAGDAGTCQSAEGALKMSLHAQGTEGYSPASQGSGEHFSSAQATLGQSTPAEQSVGPLPSTSGPQGSTETTQVLLKSFPSDARPLAISLSAQGTLGPLSFTQGALGPSLCLKLSTPQEGMARTVPSSEMASKNRTSSQKAPRVSPSTQHTVQHSLSSPRATGHFFSCQNSTDSFLSSTESEKHPPPAPDANTHPLSTSGDLGRSLSVQRSKGLSGDEERTFSVKSSLSSIQKTLGHSAYSTTVSRQYKQTQSTMCHFPSVWEDVESSHSIPGTIGALPSSPPKPVGHSYSVQGAAQSFPCGQRCLAPLRSAQGALRPSQTMLYPSRSAERAPQPSAAYPAVPETYVNSPSIREAAGSSTAAAGHVHHFPSVQGTPSISHSDQGTVGPYLSEEGTPKLTKSSQEYRAYSLPVTDPVGHFFSVEESLGKAKHAEPPVQPLSLTPGNQGSTQNTQVLLGCLSSDPKPLGISLSAQGTQEPWSSIQGALGPSLCAQGSLKLSTSEQGTVGTVPPSQKASKLLTSSQKALRFSPSAQHSLPSLRATGPFISSQTPQQYFFSLPGEVEHSPSVAGVQEHPLSTSGVLGPLLSSQRPKELFTDAEDTLPVQRSLSFLQTPLQQSSYFTKDLEQNKQIQSTLQHFPCMGKDVQSSQPVPRTIGFLQPSHQETGGHSFILEGTQSFPPVQECLASLQSTKGPLKLFMSSQSKPNSSQSPEWALQSSAPSETFRETYKPFMSSTKHSASFEGPVEDSPSIQGTAGNFKSAPGHLGLPVSAKGAPSSSLSDQWAVQTYLSAEGTPNMPKSSQETIAYSPSVPHTGGHFLSAQTTVVKSTSKKRSVGPLPSPPGPLGSTRNTKDPIGSLFSDRSPLGISLSTKGPVEYSLSPSKPTGLSVSPHGALASAPLSHGGEMTHSYSQMPQRTSQSARSSLQHPSSLPVFLDSSQYEHYTPGSVQFPPGTGTSTPCVAGSKETTSFNVGYPEHLLHAGGPPKLSICAQGTLCSISSSQDNGDPWYPSSGDLGTSQLSQKNLIHLSHVRGSMKSSPFASCPAEPSLLDRVPRRHSAHAPGDPEPLISAHCPLELTTSAQRSLDPSGSSTGCLDSLSSSSYILNLRRNQEQLLPVQENLEMSPLPVGTSAYLPCGSEPLGIGTLGQGNQATSRSAQGAVSPCLSTQGSMGLSTSTKSTLRQSPFSPWILNPPSHTQGTGTQSTSAQSTGAHSLSTPVPKGYTHHDQNMGGPLKSVQGSPRISLTSQRSVEPSMSPRQLPGYPSSEPGIRKSSTATPGHVRSEKVPRELFIATKANLNPLHSSQSTVEPLFSKQVNFVLPTPAQGTLGPSPSCQGPLESLQSAPRGQQMNPPASDSSGYMPSSKEHMVISLSGQGILGSSVSSQGPLESLQSSQRVQQTHPSASDSSGSMLSSKEHIVISLSIPGTLESIPSALRHLVIHLSLQENPVPLLFVQEAGGPCLPPQGTVDLSTCTGGSLGISNPSPPRDFGIAPSTPATLGSSPCAQVDLGAPRPVPLPLKPPVSKGVLETATSSQGDVKFLHATQENKKPLLLGQDDLGLWIPCLGTQPSSQFSQEEIKLLPSTQGDFKIAPSTSWSVANLLSASESPGFFTSVHHDAKVSSLSSQNNLGISLSSQKSLKPSETAQISLEHSTSSQGSLPPALSVPGTHSLPQQGWQSMSESAHVTLGQSPPQECYDANALSTQGALGILTSAQQSVGQSMFAQGAPTSSISSHKVVGLDKQGSTAPLSILQGVRLPVPAQRILGTLPSSQVILETSPSAQRTVETSSAVQGALQFQPHSPSAQDSIGLSPPSGKTHQPLTLTPETSGRLSSMQETCKTSASVSGAPDTLAYVPELLRHFKSFENALGPLTFGQGILGAPTTLQETLALSKPAQGPLKPMASAQETVGTSFSTEFTGAQGDFFPIAPHDCCRRESPYAQTRPRASKCNKRILSCVPFPGGDIRDSLLELDGLKSIHFGKSRLPSSKYVQNDSSSTSPPQRTVPTQKSSELSFISCTSHRDHLRHSSSPSLPSRESSTHSKSESHKTRSEDASLDQACLKSVPSDEGSKLCPSYKKEGETSISDKKGTKHKTEPNGSLSTSEPCTGVYRTSGSQPESLLSPTSHQGIIGWSKSIKIKWEKACSDQRDFDTSHSRQKGCQPSSSSKKGLTRSSFSIRGQKQKASHNDSISPSIFTEGGMGTTTSHEENLTYFASPQRTAMHTSTRRNLKDDPYNQGAIKTSPTDPEHFKTSPDVYSTHEGVKTCSSPQGDVSHLDTTDEWLKHAQEEEKPSISPKGGCRGLLSAPIPKEKARSSPDIQQTVTHTISQLDMRSYISNSGKDIALQDEYGALMHNPSVLGGCRYHSKLYPTNLQRIPLRKWRLSSNLSPKEGQRPFQSDQHGPRFSYSQYNDMYQPCSQCALQPLGALDDIEGLLCTPPNNLGLRLAPGEQWKFRDLFSNPQWIRPLTSALDSHRLSPSAQGGNRAPWPLTWKF